MDFNWMHSKLIFYGYFLFFLTNLDIMDDNFILRDVQKWKNFASVFVIINNVDLRFTLTFTHIKPKNVKTIYLLNNKFFYRLLSISLGFYMCKKGQNQEVIKTEA